MIPLDSIVFTTFEVFSLSNQSFSLNIPYYCQQCGLCCTETSFPGSKKEIKTLLSEFKAFNFDLSVDCEIEHAFQKQPCVFLDNKTCRIYSQRPILCREWYPRVKSKCLAFELHQKIGKRILKNRNYRIGTREVIFIGKYNPNPVYPLIEKLDFIDENVFTNYHFPSIDVALQILELLHEFQLTDIELDIFKAINPIYKHINQSTSIF